MGDLNLKFDERFIPKILSGEKVITRRPIWASWYYKEGQRTRVRDGKVHGWIRITKVKDELLGDIKSYDEDEVRKEGFESLDGFFDYWRKRYKKVDLGLRVRRIEFKLEEVTG